MQYWRNLLQLVIACIACNVAQAIAGPGSGNIQGIPTPWMFQNGRQPSYDAFDKYTVGQFLNNLNKSDPASLGAFFVRPYAARQAYTGVLVDDQLTSYSAGNPLHGLNGGDNWTTSYVVHQVLPWLTWDVLTNSTYNVGDQWSGKNGGDNNNNAVFLSWNGPVVEHMPPPVFTLTSGCISGGCTFSISGMPSTTYGVFMCFDGNPLNTTTFGVGSCGGTGFDPTSTNTFLFQNGAGGCGTPITAHVLCATFTVNVAYTNGFGQLSDIGTYALSCQ